MCAHGVAHPPRRPNPGRHDWGRLDQQWGGEKQAINPGDVIWTPPGVKHWHGATETTAMTHIAIQASVDGTPVNWLEHVSDADYFA